MRRLWRPTTGDPAADVRQHVLSEMNALSRSLRRGFDADTAGAIAEAVVAMTGARAVAVTEDERLAASAGDELPWHESVGERARMVLDRRRSSRPTIYEFTVGRENVEVAVVVIAVDGVPAGTVHVVMPAGATADLSELAELGAFVSTQLELGELEQSRLYAAEAELRALRAQVSPHFLHNALTAIAGLVNSNPEQARELIATLAEFLRATFRTKAPMATVAEELRLVESYLELERARFGDRFEIRLNIAPETLPVPIPFLTIQPLVENAIRHGLEARPGRGRLWIVAENAGPEIAISVEDDGVGVDPALLRAALEGSDETEHVGVVAVDTRLRSYFGPEYGLTISTGSDAGTLATFRLPKASRGRPEPGQPRRM